MRITTYSEMGWNGLRYVETRSEGYEYDGRIAECKGGGGSSAPTNQTVTQKAEPPEWVKPYSLDYLKRASPLSKQPYNPYPYSRVSSLTPEHYAGMQNVVDQATYGDAGVNLARENYGQTMRGDFLNPDTNPYLRSTYDRAAQDVTDQYTYGTAPVQQSQAARAGALGGSADAQVAQMDRWGLGNNLGNLATDIYGGNYAMERGNQMQGMGMASQMNEIGYRDAQALMGVGDINRDYSQAQINQDYEDYLAAQMWPYQQLDVLGNALGVASGGGGTTVTTQPSFYQPNRTAGMLGGGMLGYGLAQNTQYPWLGAGAGALAGGMM